MRRRVTMIVSDVHLSTLGPEPWHRQVEAQPDRLLASTIAQALTRARAERASFTLVLNGDIFDFDAPSASPDEPALAARRTEAGAAHMMRRILADHPVFTEALYRVVMCGGQVIVLPGNHDAQLAFPVVRAELRRAIGTGLGLSFRSWFYLSPEGLLVEHGHQYDPFCRMERMYPTSGRLEDTIGTITTHYGAVIFDNVSPYVADPFAAVGASGGANTVLGNISDKRDAALACFRELLLVPPKDPKLGDGNSSCAAWLVQVAAEARARAIAVQNHQALAAPKENALLLTRAIEREYDYGRDVERRQKSAMAQIAGLYGARAVAMGHTHEAFVDRLPSGHMFANSGTWAPLSPAQNAKGPAGTFVWIVADRARMETRLHRVMADGRII